eukprot:scaffold17883_cov32-Attheya_sp.AAC.4
MGLIGIASTDIPRSRVNWMDVARTCANLVPVNMANLLYMCAFPSAAHAQEASPSLSAGEANEDLRRNQDRQKALAEIEARRQSGEEPNVKLYQKCLSNTSRYVGLVARLLQSMELPFVVAPGEADGQLAACAKDGVVISSDNDMLALGVARKVRVLRGGWMSGEAERLLLVDCPPSPNSDPDHSVSGLLLQAHRADFDRWCSPAIPWICCAWRGPAHLLITTQSASFKKDESSRPTKGRGQKTDPKQYLSILEFCVQPTSIETGDTHGSGKIVDVSRAFCVCKSGAGKCVHDGMAIRDHIRMWGPLSVDERICTSNPKTWKNRGADKTRVFNPMMLIRELGFEKLVEGRKKQFRAFREPSYENYDVLSAGDRDLFEIRVNQQILFPFYDALQNGRKDKRTNLPILAPLATIFDCSDLSQRVLGTLLRC